MTVGTRLVHQSPTQIHTLLNTPTNDWWEWEWRRKGSKRGETKVFWWTSDSEVLMTVAPLWIYITSPWPRIVCHFYSFVVVVLRKRINPLTSIILSTLEPLPNHKESKLFNPVQSWRDTGSKDQTFYSYNYPRGDTISFLTSSTGITKKVEFMENLV